MAWKPQPGIGTCIYCRGGGPFTKEHALQRGLGGNMTLLEMVCDNCNTKKFSSLDQELAEKSLPAFSRVAFAAKDGKRVQLGGDHFHLDEETGVWADVSLENEMQMVFLPQVRLVEIAEDGTAGQIAVLGSEAKSIDGLFALIDKRIANDSFLRTHTKVGPRLYGDAARLVKHRRDGMFVRAATVDDGNVFLERLAHAWPKVRHKLSAAESLPSKTIERPSATLTQSVHLNRVYRAIAKTAFNVLAAKRGAAFVLRSEFDPLRYYITGADELVLGPMPQDEVIVDPRFVAPLKFGAQALATESHVVILYYAAPVLLAYVTLYKHHSFVVQLAELRLSDLLIDVHEFSTDRTHHEALDFDEIYKRLTARRGT